MLTRFYYSHKEGFISQVGSKLAINPDSFLHPGTKVMLRSVDIDLRGVWIFDFKGLGEFLIVD